MLTDTSNIREAARKMSNLGPREILITHRNGLLVYANGQFYEEGFFPKKLIGRSGRGDTCIAAYMAKRLNASSSRSNYLGSSSNQPEDGSRRSFSTNNLGG